MRDIHSTFITLLTALLKRRETHTMDDTLVTQDLKCPSRRKRRRKSLSERCQVCSDKASTQQHYGSKAHLCFSCRAFFRRCVKQNREFVEIECINHILQAAGTCQITPENRSVCRYVTVVSPFFRKNFDAFPFIYF